jgi:hypothetical protein
LESLHGKGYLENQGIDRRIILKFILGRIGFAGVD